MKINKTKIILLILFSVALISIAIIIVMQNIKTKEVELNNQASTDLSYPISFSQNINLESLDNTILQTKYIHPSNIFAYNFPAGWEFTKGREHIGLIPSVHKEVPLNEIVTIFTIKTDKSLEEWSKEYDGSGYKIEETKVINGYPVKYIFKESDALTMQIYTFKYQDNIVRLNLRQKDNSIIQYDFTDYVADFESIVNSVEFIE